MYQTRKLNEENYYKEQSRVAILDFCNGYEDNKDIPQFKQSLEQLHFSVLEDGDKIDIQRTVLNHVHMIYVKVFEKSSEFKELEFLESFNSKNLKRLIDVPKIIILICVRPTITTDGERYEEPKKSQIPEEADLLVLKFDTERLGNVLQKLSCGFEEIYQQDTSSLTNFIIQLRNNSEECFDLTVTATLRRRYVFHKIVPKQHNLRIIKKVLPIQKLPSKVEMLKCLIEKIEITGNREMMKFYKDNNLKEIKQQIESNNFNGDPEIISNIIFAKLDWTNESNVSFNKYTFMFVVLGSVFLFFYTNMAKT